MADGCPARATLDALAAGKISEDERSLLETHFERCHLCAEQLEAITRAQLKQMVGLDGSHVVARVPREERSSDPVVLASLMRRALEDSLAFASVDPARLIELLDPPRVQGALGTFAGYDVTEIAGSGGMGLVLKARDPTLERTVALKILSPSRAWDEESVGRFLREARTIAAIQHDNIVPVYSAGREKDLPYLVMPFFLEGTLEQRLQRVPRMGMADVIRIGMQLARALEVTHAQGVLHRDIKPSNVLLEGGLDRVRLADFGLAQPVSQSPGSQGLIAGTPEYMSPEQARGEPVDARSDLFGLGALLFRLATGENVYSGESVKEILRVAAGGNPKTLREVGADVTPALAQSINRLLAPRPEERFASATEVVDALGRAASRYRRWIKRGAGVALAACLVLSGGVAALDCSGVTVIVNTLLAKVCGESFFIRGRFGTYPELADAVEAPGPGRLLKCAIRASGSRATSVLAASH